MHLPARRRAVATARNAAAAALILTFTAVTLSAAPVSAATITETASITAGSPTYNRVAVGSCALSGVTAQYTTIPFTTVGDDATTLNISVSASGFTPVVTLYQGAFLPENANVNCYTLASNGNINVGFGALPDPFESMNWILVIASDSGTGSVTATIESTNTGVEGPGGPPVDTTDPVLSVPGNMTVETTGPAGAVATFSATATDNSGSATVSCSPPSGSTFALGSNTVTCTAEDPSGNTDTGTFTVTVVDTVDPVVTVPANMTLEATSSAGAIATFTATATDVDPPDPPVVCAPASGTTFAKGTTTVTCEAADVSGNIGNAQFTVTVVDTTDPVLPTPPNQTLEATSPTGAVATYAPVATDAGTPNPPVGCAPISGSTFALGTTPVTCIATDEAGNSASASFDISVVDTTDPVLTLPGDTFETATGPAGAVVTYTATATDLVDPTPTVSCVPAAGDLFPLGETTVSCTATDDEGNSTTDSFTVTVLDEGDPVLVLPSNITEEATGPTGATVTFEATATDDVDATPDVVCTPASGTTFAIGDTTVTCTATDNDGNDTTGSFTVAVTDTSAPVLDLPDDISATATGPDGAVVTFTATATDLVAGDVPVQCTPPSGSTFHVGTNTVTCTATDATGAATLARGFRFVEQVVGGNVATGTFTIDVAGLPPTTTTTTTTLPGTTTTTTTTLPGTTTTIAGTTTTVAGSLPTTGAGSTGSVATLATITVLLGAAFVGMAALLRFRRPD